MDAKERARRRAKRKKNRAWARTERLAGTRKHGSAHGDGTPLPTWTAARGTAHVPDEKWKVPPEWEVDRVKKVEHTGEQLSLARIHGAERGSYQGQARMHEPEPGYRGTRIVQSWTEREQQGM